MTGEGFRRSRRSLAPRTCCNHHVSNGKETKTATQSDEHLGFPVNLSADIELLAAFWEQSGAGDDGVWAHDFLVVCKSCQDKPCINDGVLDLR